MARAALLLTLVVPLALGGCGTPAQTVVSKPPTPPAAGDSLTEDPSPEAFPGRTVTLAEFVARLREEVATLARRPEMAREFRGFALRHGLDAGDPLLLRDYVAVRTVFEAVRDAGWWGVRWEITDRPPDSRAIWAQWRRFAPPGGEPVVTATAECDEISALFAFLAGKLGVRGVGLFWPLTNHAIAAWVIRQPGRNEARVAVPTSFLFLSYADRFDGIRKPDFDPFRQKTVHEYREADAPDALEIPAALGDFFIRQVRRYGACSTETLHFIAFNRRQLRENPRLRQLVLDEIGRMRRALAGGDAPRPDLVALERFAAELPGTGDPRM
ncbi:MAG: hypothetical protein KA419_15345 [Acidobacteria bacterium]|nr:hypothetical protein [Acidobacteriota bacterium]